MDYKDCSDHLNYDIHTFQMHFGTSSFHLCHPSNWCTNQGLEAIKGKCSDGISAPSVVPKKIKSDMQMIVLMHRQKHMNTYLSIAMTTSVKTEAHTDIPCTRPLSLHIMLLNGQPVH